MKINNLIEKMKTIVPVPKYLLYPLLLSSCTLAVIHSIGIFNELKSKIDEKIKED